MTGFSVTPAEIAQAALEFARGQHQLNSSWSALGTALEGQAGMAGDDGYARTFDSRYQRGAEAAWAAFAKAFDALGGISAGLTQTANNYLKADHHSTIGAAGPPAVVGPAGAWAGVVCIPAIDAAIGPGEPGLPGPLARFWPGAHPNQLRAAAAAWRAAGSAAEQAAGRLNTVIGSLTDVNDGADQRAIEGFWAKVYRIGDPHTVLAGLPMLCSALAEACDRYAAAVDHARSVMKWALAGAGIAIGVTSIVGAGATIFTLGASDAGAGAADAAEAAAILAPQADAAAAAVASEMDAAVAADLVAAVEAATSATPAVELVEAETTEVGQALDEELTQSEDGKPPEPAASYAEKIDNILNPGGQPIGEPGSSPACRLVGDQEQLDQVWNELKTELGRDPQSVGPGGQIQKIELGEHTYVQYRPWSNTGGPTIDISEPGQQIRIIHIG